MFLLLARMLHIRALPRRARVRGALLWQPLRRPVLFCQARTRAIWLPKRVDQPIEFLAGESAARARLARRRAKDALDATRRIGCAQSLMLKLGRIRAVGVILPWLQLAIAGTVRGARFVRGVSGGCMFSRAAATQRTLTTSCCSRCWGVQENCQGSAFGDARETSHNYSDARGGPVSAQWPKSFGCHQIRVRRRLAPALSTG